MNAFPIEHGPRTGESILFLHGGNVAGWSWQPQVERLPGRHLLTPDLLGYGDRADRDFPGLDGAADDLAELIAERAVDGRAHVVGLSLGGFTALRLAHRHPGLVRSVLVTGVALTGYSAVERALIGPQVPLWRRRWYWAAQAPLFRIPADDRELFVTTATAPSDATNQRMFRETTRSTAPERFDFTGPLLAVSGQRETASVRRAFAPLRAVAPQLQTWVAPGMHHPWNVQDPELFSRMVAQFVDTATWP